MSQKLERMIPELQQEEKRLQNALAGYDQQLAELKRVQRVLKLLTDEPANGQKPSPTMDDLIRLTEQVLDERTVCHEEVLQEAVAEALTKDGKSKMGFKKKFKQALLDEKFTQDDEGFRLAIS